MRRVALYTVGAARFLGYASVEPITGKPLVCHIHSVDRAEYELGQQFSWWLARSRIQEAAILVADYLITLSAGRGNQLRSGWLCAASLHGKLVTDCSAWDRRDRVALWRARRMARRRRAMVDQDSDVHLAFLGLILAVV